MNLGAPPENHPYYGQPSADGPSLVIFLPTLESSWASVAGTALNARCLPMRDTSNVTGDGASRERIDAMLARVSRWALMPLMLTIKSPGCRPASKAGEG